MKALLLALSALAGPGLDDLSVATRDRDGTIGAAASPGLSPATQFQAGSISKWACTVAVLRLVDRDRMTLDDTVGALLPTFEGPPDIRLRDLLANRSGLADGLGPAMQAEGQDAILARDEDAMTAANAYAAGPAVAAPGRAYSYDLVNWILVQAILEAQSGEPIATVMDLELFGPDEANLPDTFIATGAPPLDHAPHIDGPTGALPRWAGCAGGMVTTPTDLVRLMDWTATGAISDDSLAALTTVTTPEEGYALGGSIRRDQDMHTTWFWLSGSNGAFKSLAAYRLDTREGFAAMDAVNDVGRLEEARDLWLAESTK